MSTGPLMACTLGESGRRKREAQIRDFLRDAAESVSERADGIDVRFPGEADCLREIADLMSIERSCCSFLRFELTVEAGEGPIHLAITGPEGTRQLLRSWYV